MVHDLEKVWRTSQHKREEQKASLDFQQPPLLEENKGVEDQMFSMMFVYHYTIDSNDILLSSTSQYIHVKKRDKIDKRYVKYFTLKLKKTTSNK